MFLSDSACSKSIFCQLMPRAFVVPTPQPSVLIYKDQKFRSSLITLHFLFPFLTVVDPEDDQLISLRSLLTVPPVGGLSPSHSPFSLRHIPDLYLYVAAAIPDSRQIYE